jgi:hypothetical protein
MVNTPRRLVIDRGVRLPSADALAGERHAIARARLDLVRERAFQVCVGLQPLDLAALQLCEIMVAIVRRVRVADCVSPVVDNCDKGETFSQESSTKTIINQKFE